MESEERVFEDILFLSTASKNDRERSNGVWTGYLMVPNWIDYGRRVHSDTLNFIGSSVAIKEVVARPILQQRRARRSKQKAARVIKRNKCLGVFVVEREIRKDTAMVGQITTLLLNRVR